MMICNFSELNDVVGGGFFLNRDLNAKYKIKKQLA